MNDERGNITVLTLGLAMVVMAVTGLAVDGTRAFIARRSLQNAADAAAVTGASAVDVTRYYRSGGSDVRVDERRAENAAARLLTRRGLVTTTHVIAGDDGVRVVLRTTVPSSFLRLVGIDRIDVSAEAAAEPFPQPPSIGR